ncbi:MAG TPA: hypothetical protein VE592_05415, partial [Geminicoccaceae bacterium]|nr:hypothetical protein [Geminicoccaceae bacterium]
MIGGSGVWRAVALAVIAMAAAATARAQGDPEVGREAAMWSITRATAPMPDQRCRRCSATV